MVVIYGMGGSRDHNGQCFGRQQSEQTAVGTRERSNSRGLTGGQRHWRVVFLWIFLAWNV